MADNETLAGMLGDGTKSFLEYLRRSGRNLAEVPGGVTDWLAGGAKSGADPTLAMMRPGVADQPFLPTADSGGRLGMLASALTGPMMPMTVPKGGTVLGAGPVMRTAEKIAEAAPAEYDPFARFIQVSDLRDRAAKRLAEEGGKPVVLMNPQNRNGAFISPNSDEHGAWRMTDFDQKGFSGHRYFDDKEQAARAAYADGYKDKNRNLLREYSRLDTFSDGNDATHARLQKATEEQKRAAIAELLRNGGA